MPRRLGTTIITLPERIDDELRHHPAADIPLLQRRRQRTEAPYPAPAYRVTTVAAHGPDVVIAKDGRIVDEDFLARTERLGGEEKKLIAGLGDAGVRCTAVIQIPSRLIAGIEIRLGAETEAVVGECAASFPEDAVVHDSPDDLDDGLAWPIRLPGMKPNAIAPGTDDDAFQWMDTMMAEYERSLKLVVQ